MILSILLSLSCLGEKEQATEKESQIEHIEQAKVLFGKIPEPEKVSEDMKKLGFLLYTDKYLSKNKNQSCETCHLLKNNGMDGIKVSVGSEGIPVERNSPSTFNSQFHIAQFWDGRAKDLHEQAGGPILAAGEMGMPSKEAVVEIISSNKVYVDLFEKTFDSKITFENITKAISEFEKTLVTEDKFDDWIDGSYEMTEEELKGYKLFVSTGCAGCHNGPLFGANSFQKVGVFHPYEDAHNDMGRYNVTGLESDKKVFKVPSLRNATNTSPYFHDGEVSTINDAVKIMAKIQLNKDLSEEEVESIVVFLKVLENKQ